MTEVVFKRKFRWTLSGELPGGNLEDTFVKVASRPTLEEEIDFLSINCVIPSLEWQYISVTAYDIHNINFSIFEPTIPIPIDKSKKYRSIDDPFEISYSDDLKQILSKEEKTGKFTLSLYDGCNNLLEQWDLKNACVCNMRYDHEYGYGYDDLLELTIKYKY